MKDKKLKMTISKELLEHLEDKLEINDAMLMAQDLERAQLAGKRELFLYLKQFER